MLVVGVCVSPALDGKGISDCSPKKKSTAGSMEIRRCDISMTKIQKVCIFSLYFLFRVIHKYTSNQCVINP